MSLGPDELPPLDPAKVVSDRRWSDWRGTPKRPEQSESSVSSDRLSEVVLTDTAFSALAALMPRPRAWPSTAPLTAFRIRQHSRLPLQTHDTHFKTPQSAITVDSQFASRGDGIVFSSPISTWDSRSGFY